LGCLFLYFETNSLDKMLIEKGKMVYTVLRRNGISQVEF